MTARSAGEKGSKMMSSWWWMWIALMLVFMAPSLGYGWGYRGWGPPYPRYIQRRRAKQAVGAAGPSSFSHQSWGWGGDLVWGVFLLGMVGAVCISLWR